MDDEGGHRERGNRLLREGDVAGALRAYDLGIVKNASDKVLHSNRSAALLALHRPEDALAAAQRAVELDPSFPRARQRMGDALGALQRDAEACSSYAEGAMRAEEAKLAAEETLEAEADGEPAAVGGGAADGGSARDGPAPDTAPPSGEPARREEQDRRKTLVAMETMATDLGARQRSAAERAVSHIVSLSARLQGAGPARVRDAVASLGADVARTFVPTARRMMGIKPSRVRSEKATEWVMRCLADDPVRAVDTFAAVHALLENRIEKFRKRTTPWGPWDILERVDVVIEAVKGDTSVPREQAIDTANLLRAYERTRETVVALDTAEDPTAVWVSALETMAAYLNEAISGAVPPGHAAGRGGGPRSPAAAGFPPPQNRAPGTAHSPHGPRPDQGLPFRTSPHGGGFAPGAAPHHHQGSHNFPTSHTGPATAPVPSREAKAAAAATPDDIE